MKKIGLICTAVLLCGSLSACGGQSSNSKLSKLRAEHSSLVKKYKHSNKKGHSKQSKNGSVKKENKSNDTYGSKANKISKSQNKPSNDYKHDQSSNRSSSPTSNSDSAYYASLQKANDDYWKNLSPQEQQQWSQWEDGESRANDPYQNGYYNNQSSTAPSAESSR